MGRLILEYRDGGITRIERPVKADRLQIHDVERHHLADALHVAGQQLVNAAGLDNGGGTDPAKRLLAAFQGAAADANVNLPERFLLTLADIAVTELPLIR